MLIESYKKIKEEIMRLINKLISVFFFKNTENGKQFPFC